MTCENDKKYTVQLLTVMAAYIAITFGSVLALKNYDLDGFRILIAITPMVPMVGALIVIMRHVRNMDEFQRQIQLEACVFSMVATGMICGTYGFIEGAGYPPLDIIWVMPMLMLGWGFGSFVAKRRYQ
jgi:hypothetical protein